ncbi:MAG: hypothetical protein QW115_03400, partial [Thermoplasmata archaeon]
PIYHWTDRRVIAHIALCVLTLLVKEILERELGKEVMIRILEKFSYSIDTVKGCFEWFGSE